MGYTPKFDGWGNTDCGAGIRTASATSLMTHE
jgi:hypothetical protein